MPPVLTLPQFAGLLMHMAQTLPHARHRALEHAAQIVEDEVKALIGTYNARPRWPELADSTKEDRARQGFSPNEPLLRTGETRDSVHHMVRGNVAHVGSDNDKLVWNALGTKSIPARDPFVPAVLRRIRAIEHAIGRTMHAHLSSGVYPSASGHPFNRYDHTIA